MADTVTSQLIANGPRNLILKFTNFSDGTGETGVKKVDAQSTTYANQGTVPGTHLKIARIIWAVTGGSIRIQWDATTAVDLWDISGFGTYDFTAAPLPNALTAGSTGSILFTTVGFAANSSYTVDLEMYKGV